MTDTHLFLIACVECNGGQLFFNITFALKCISTKPWKFRQNFQKSKRSPST